LICIAGMGRSQRKVGAWAGTKQCGEPLEAEHTLKSLRSISERVMEAAPKLPSAQRRFKKNIVQGNDGVDKPLGPLANDWVGRAFRQKPSRRLIKTSKGNVRC
jgi:hypothetical protein